MGDRAETSTRPPAPDPAGESAPDPAGDAGPEPEPGAAPAATRRAPGRSSPAAFEAWAFLELFALCGFVVVQPLLEILGGSPDFFLFHGVTTGQILVLVAIFTLVPPVAVWGIGALAGLVGRAIGGSGSDSGAGGRVRRAVHRASVGMLFLLFVVQLGKHLTGIRGTLLVALAVVAAVVMVVGHARFSATRQLLRFAAVGPLVFGLLFAFASPASAVMFPGNRPGAGGEARVVGPHPPVVMIVLDELALLSLLADGPDGQIDAQRFPSFARLAADSTWWRNATTVAGWTPYALPSMLTGRLPADHAAPHYAVYPDNLFTLLGDAYRIEASESISQLCPPWHCGDRVDDSRGGLPVALGESASLLREVMSPTDPVRDPYDDFAEPTVAERLGEVAAARSDRPDFLFRQRLGVSQPVRYHEFLTRLSDREAAAGDDRPVLHFLHLLLPHTPWTYLPDGMRYENVPGLPVDGPWWGRLALQRHLLQLEYTDLLLGEALRTLDEQGLYDEALVVLTSDHGVALTPGPADGGWIAGDRALGPDNHGAEELAWVPLFIKEPGQTEGRIDERNWQHVDLLPTLADYAGLEVEWPVDGISWRRDARTGADKIFYSGLDDVRTLDGPAFYQRILADPGAIPPVPPAPLPELVGTATTDLPTRDGPAAGEVENADSFAEVDPESGIVPALVYGTVSRDVAEGTPLAIAVNGRIGAVVPVVAGAENARRFAGLIEDVSLFVSGINQVELFLVPDGHTLHRIG